MISFDRRKAFRYSLAHITISSTSSPNPQNEGEAVSEGNAFAQPTTAVAESTTAVTQTTTVAETTTPGSIRETGAEMQHISEETLTNTEAAKTFDTQKFTPPYNLILQCNGGDGCRICNGPREPVEVCLI
ncbi:hypothetical protein CPB97_005563 [Podila verticillata]|nr:hypothetical protein CPB97_005563 [Podila verticillata]